MEIVVIAGIIFAILFNFVNGLNDAANSIATVVATRVLTPLQGVLMAAAFNMIGPLIFTTAIAQTIGKGIVETGFLTTDVILIGMMVAVMWVFLSSYLGIPISASHALVGGLLGSAIAYGGLAVVILPPLSTVQILILSILAGGVGGALVLGGLARYKGEKKLAAYFGLGALCGVAISIPFAIIAGILPISGLLAIVVFIVVSPMLGMIAAFLLGMVIIKVFRNAQGKTMNAIFQKLQVFSAAFYSIGHGSNDAQNAMGVITAILVAAGLLTEFVVPLWVIIISGASIALGTFLGGWKVVETMGTKITKLRTYQGFCAETGGGVVLSFVTAFGVPVSTTHAISGAIMGVGATRGYSAVQWGIVRRIVTAWVITIPITAAFAFAFFLVYAAIFF
jgi:PiT family inorganic phosphate transporter